MAQWRSRSYRLAMVMAVVFPAVTAGLLTRPAQAQVTGVTGSAYGYSLSASLFGGTVNNVGPVPVVTLPAGGSASPVTASAPTGSAAIDPATFFSSGPINVSTQGTTAGGTVTSSATINNLNTSQNEVLTATSIAATCTASTSGVTGSATVTGGTLQTDNGDNDPANQIPDHPAVNTPVPANPAPNTTIEGHLHVGNATDSFRYVFNEQIRNADGSLTVNAAHQYLLGNIARGELIIGHVVCGVTGTAATTTTTAPGATTTTAPGATTTTVVGTTTTTAGATTTTSSTSTSTSTSTTAAPTTTSSVATGGVSGGAYGFFVTVSLFGGPAATRGPTPTVSLPAAGSASPVTASAPTGDASFGPAILFSSDRLDASTQGTPGGTVTSSASAANVNRSGQEQLTAATISSTCTASSTGASGSATLSGAKVTLSSGANLDSEADDTVMQIPANPSPNTSYNGKIENVGDTFRLVVNEQQTSGGSITVNGAHLYLLGPTAKGELIIAQSRCGATTGTATAAGGGGATAVGGGGGLSSTGTDAVLLVAFGLVLLTGGGTTAFWARDLRGRRPVTRRMPWTRHTLLR
jgi:hypothetical protein